jgi:hypothetical protein
MVDGDVGGVGVQIADPDATREALAAYDVVVRRAFTAVPADDWAELA